MGQCYEFGVAIHPGCGHAMRVDKLGGACVCPTCDARCEGQFEACGPILEQPGYVPVTAPTWAIDCVDPPARDQTLPRFARHDAAPPMSAPATEPAGVVDAEALAIMRAEMAAVTADLRIALDQALARPPSPVAPTPDVDTAQIVRSTQAQALRVIGPALSEIRDELLGAIHGVRSDLTDRYKELADSYDNLSESYAKLSAAVDEERDMTRAVVEGLARVARRVGRLEKTLGTQPPP